MSPRTLVEPESSITPGDSFPSPRAFAIGTGVAFQTIGSIYAFIAILAWAISAWILPRASGPAAQWTDFLAHENLPAAMITILILVSFVGGLALIAAGVGLQGERRRSGIVAMTVSGLMVPCYVVVAIILLVALNRIFTAIGILVLALPAGVLFMLAGYSASILRKFPPPPDLNAATPELLEEFRRKRLERLKHYDP